jgi:hypothetical protein
VVLAALAALVLAELALRAWTPEEVTAFANERSSGPGGALHPERGAYELDPELGYRPVLGGPEYGPHGALANEYALAKPDNARRLLFLGDSVTRRAKIQEGLAELLGAPGFEYWNAGVEGYATAQEAAYFRRYLAPLGADCVVLTFHLNDFQTTPVTFLDGARLVMVYAKRSTRALNPWLLRHSYLYRWIQSRGFERTELTPTAAPAGVQEEIEAALRELRDLATSHGGRLVVLVLPWLRPVAEWPGSLPGKRAWVLSTLERLGIEHYDFQASLEAALAEGEVVTEVERDPQHPSAAFGRRMARALLAAGFRP